MSDLQIPDRTEAEARAELKEERLQSLLRTIAQAERTLSDMNDRNEGFVALAGAASVAMGEIIAAFRKYQGIRI